MTKLFISYRRSDSEGYAGRIYDHLTRFFDPSNVFMDVDSIAPGANFVETLNKTLSEIDVMLVVIGSRWLAADDDKGRRRLDKKDDFVYQEISAALKRDIAVIPVLVGKTDMPSASDLPDEIAGLALRNAVLLRHERFTDDTKRLTTAIINLSAELLNNKTDELIRKFEKDVSAEYENAFVYENVDGDPRIKLYFASEEGVSTQFQSHLLTDAIVHLIEAADVSGWDKHPDELQPEAFWKAILDAIAASYRLQYPFQTDNQSDYDLLRQLITDLDRAQPTIAPKSGPYRAIRVIDSDDDTEVKDIESKWHEKTEEVAEAIYDNLTAEDPDILIVGEVTVLAQGFGSQRQIVCRFDDLNTADKKILKDMGWEFGRQLKHQYSTDANSIESLAESLIAAHRAIYRSVEDVSIRYRQR